jgi:voltage-gated potassium channel
MRRTLVLSILALLGVVVGGFFGFLITEDFWGDPLDALYLTFMTITTVGYGDLVPVTPEGKVVAMMVAIGGIGAGISTLQAVFNLIISNNLRAELGLPERRTKMKDHYIICGHGNVGREVADRLRANGERFVVVEKDPDKVLTLVGEGIEVIRGDAEDEEVLIKAGIMNAKGLIATMKDPQNLVTVLTARTMNQGMFIISEVEDDKNEPKLKKVGANVTVNCHSMGARIMVGRARQIESDPVCGGDLNGMTLFSAEYDGRTFHFCSSECREAFKVHPERFMQWQKAIDDSCGITP